MGGTSRRMGRTMKQWHRHEMVGEMNLPRLREVPEPPDKPFPEPPQERLRPVLEEPGALFGVGTVGQSETGERDGTCSQ